MKALPTPRRPKKSGRPRGRPPNSKPSPRVPLLVSKQSTPVIPSSDFSIQGRRRPRKAIGTTGLIQYDGYINEEFLPDLSGQNAIRVYNEMRMNDATVAGMLHAAEHLIQNVSINFKPADDSNLAMQTKDLVETSLYDMATSWRNTLSEILTFFWAGWSWIQLTPKNRNGYSRDPVKSSKHNDGLLGWADAMPHGQDALVRWKLDDQNRVLGIYHRPQTGQETFIPSTRSLHFKTRSEKWNPAGQSVLRRSYRAYTFKKKIEEIEAIGIERDLNGLPIMTPPENVDLWNTADPKAVTGLAAAETIVRSVRWDKHAGLVLPFGWVFELAASKGQRNINTADVISRYNQQMAVVMLADMILIGHERVGSYALVAAKMHLFSGALETYAREISDVWNKKAIPDLLAINGFPTELSPIMGFGPVETPNLKDLATFIPALVGVPDTKLQNHLRAMANFPLLEPGEEVPEPTDDDNEGGPAPGMTGVTP